MSSTTGAQNLLVNVFRPVYTYAVPTGGTTAIFTPKLEISNVDTMSANSISVFTIAVGDSNSNVYVGSNAGNAYDLTKLCRNNTAVGFGAGNNISNVSNSVYLGFNAGTGAASASNVIAIGANATGNGTSNIYIGTNTGAAGSNNILIGHNIAPGTTSNAVRVGTLLYGDICSGTLGVGINPTYNLDVSGSGRISTRLGVGMAPVVAPLPHGLDVSGYTYIYGGVGINADPADYTLNLNGNFFASEGGDTFSFSSNADGVVQASAGYNSLRGTIVSAAAPSTTNIGTLKKGIFFVSAQDTASTSTYNSLMAYCADPTDGTNSYLLSSNVQSVNSNITIVMETGGSNIQISNVTSVRSINWSITYFPLT
jgi:hypothetical protein